METRLGFLKQGDFFYFDGIKYKVSHLLENTNGYVSCIDVNTQKVNKFHIDTDVEVEVFEKE